MYRQKNSLYYQQPTTELTHSNGITKKKNQNFCFFIVFFFFSPTPFPCFCYISLFCKTKHKTQKQKLFFPFLSFSLCSSMERARRLANRAILKRLVSGAKQYRQNETLLHTASPVSYSYTPSRYVSSLTSYVFMRRSTRSD